MISDENTEWYKKSEKRTGADLTGADLTGADLTGAYLALSGLQCVIGKHLYQVAGGIGEFGRSLTLLAEDKWKWWIGCFSGTTKELHDEIMKRHAYNEIARETCLEAMRYLTKIANLKGQVEE